MNSEEFVKRIQVAVYESSIEGCLLLLQKPPGRRPSATLVELSQWFNHLSPDDKECVRTTIQLAVRKTVFGMFAVLDGVRSIRGAGEKVGTLELWYKTQEESFLLNGPTGELLHDIFAVLVPLEQLPGEEWAK